MDGRKGVEVVVIVDGEFTIHRFFALDGFARDVLEVIEMAFPVLM